MRLIAFPQGSSTSLGRILALVKPVFFFSAFSFFKKYFKERRCIPAFVSGLLLCPERGAFFTCCAFLASFWPMVSSLKGYRHGLCLRIEALCARRAAFWGPCLTRQGWPCDGKTWKRPESQAGSSAGPAPTVFSEKANLNGAAVVGWESGFSTAARTALWQGSDRSKKPDFFQIRPLARMLCALQQPVELAVTVDIHEAR